MQARRSFARVLVASALLVFPLSGAMLGVAQAQCADPSGHCSNGGQVTFSSPPAAGPTTGPCADPSGNCPNGGLVNTQNPTGGLVNVANPNAGQSNVTNPNAGQSDVTNPSAGQSDVTNPSAGQATDGQGIAPTAPGLSVTVSPTAGTAGDEVALLGQGFSANGQGGLVFINVVDANGTAFDTNYQPMSCVDSDDTLLNLYQDLGWGCSGDAMGPLTGSSASGALTASFVVPDGAAPGPGQVCVASVFSNPVCTAFTIQGGN
jgi:hypothetical protein